MKLRYHMVQVLVALANSKPSCNFLKPSSSKFCTKINDTQFPVAHPNAHQYQLQNSLMEFLNQELQTTNMKQKETENGCDKKEEQLSAHLKHKELENVCEQKEENVTNPEAPSSQRESSPAQETLPSNGRAAEKQDSSAKPLTKTAQKKLMRMERNKALKMQRKAFEKEKRHEESEKKRKEWEEKIAAATPEEKELLMKEKLEKRQARKEKSSDRKAKLRQAMESGQNLVIDLEFADRMKQTELASLVQQVMYSYSANAKTSVPVRFSLTGVAGDIQGHLEKLSGYSNWLIHKEEKSYLEVFEDRKQDLVYLTADSDTVIKEVDESKIYIIGGLVDRNRWKGLTLEKAMNQGIATAKLPIADHLKMTGSMVLTVNQVVEIFLRFLELKDWDAAFQQVIPMRKRSSEDVYEDEDEETEAKVPQLDSED